MPALCMACTLLSGSSEELCMWFVDLVKGTACCCRAVASAAHLHTGC